MKARIASAARWLADQAMRPPRRVAAGVRWPFARLWGWWSGLDPSERVLYRAAGFLGVGFAFLHPALGLIVPGALLALVFFGFSFTRPRNG